MTAGLKVLDHLPSFRDVSEVADEQQPAVTLDASDGQFDRNRRAAMTQPHDLEPAAQDGPGFSRGHPGNTGAMPLAVLLRDQQVGQIPSEHVTFRNPERL